MPHLSVPSAVIEQALQDYLAAGGTRLQGGLAAAHRHHVLPLFADFMGCWALTVEGTLVFAPWDDPDLIEPVSDHPVDSLGVHVALANGSQLYPTLASICPTRGPSDVTCTTCDGKGNIPGAPANLRCSCGGLGWHPPLWTGPQ